MQPVEFKIKSFRINKITRKMLQKVLDFSIFECYPGDHLFKTIHGKTDG